MLAGEPNGVVADLVPGERHAETLPESRAAWRGKIGGGQLPAARSDRQTFCISRLLRGGAVTAG